MARLVMHVAGRHLELSTKKIIKSIRAYPAGLKTWALLCLAVMAVSVIGALAALPVGWEVMGTSPTMEWGLLIAGYVVLAITTSGLCLTISLGSVYGVDALRPLERRGVILAFICLAAAFGTILLDLLANPDILGKVNGTLTARLQRPAALGGSDPFTGTVFYALDDIPLFTANP